MNKTEYIIRQIGKTNKKNYENYVVTRIWNLLNNLEIKFITQQYIVRPGNKYALTDMYFPQIGLHIEVDEPHHKLNKKEDKIREEDIISVTEHDLIRIDVAGDIEAIHQEIDCAIEMIQERIEELGDAFIPWNIESELDPQTYIDKGYIALDESVSFKRSVDACNCFGCNYKGFQLGGTKHPHEENTLIWFPKLFPNDGWDNQISEDGLSICEKSVDPKIAEEHFVKYMKGNQHRRIIFARVKGPLGDVMYRFKGDFQLDVDSSNKRNELIWRRFGDRVKTYR